MIKRLSMLCAAASIMTTVALADPVSVEDLAREPALSSITMSLEGDMLVGLVHEPGTSGERRAAAVWDLSGDIDTSKPLLPASITPGNDRMRWVAASALKGGRSFLFGQQIWTGVLAGCGEGKLTGATKTYLIKQYLTNRDLTEIEEPFSVAFGRDTPDMLKECYALQRTLASISSMLPLDSEHVLVNRAQHNNSGLTGATDFLKYNIRTGDEEQMYRVQSEFGVQLIDHRTGALLAKSDVEFVDESWQFRYYLVDQNTGDLTLEGPLSTRAENRFNVNILGRQEDTGKYYIATSKFSDKNAIYLYDPSSDTFDSEPVFAHPEFDVVGMRFSQRSKDFNEVIAVQYADARIETFWIDPEMKAIHDGLQQAFPNLNIGIQNYTDDMSRILFTTSGSNAATAYYLLLDQTRVAVIGSTRPWIDEDDLSKTELVYYTARDGLKIPALLTLPTDFEEGDPAPPAIVLPHGGPWARDFANWDNWTQLLVSRGYTVLKPQYRGSQGWGRELWLAGDNEWGQKMQDDKDDGAAWLVSNGYAASDRIAIHGYSYGGFAAMAATVRENGPFQCAIAGAGVSNLTKLGNLWSNNKVQQAFQGDTVTGMDPLANADSANIPILIIHGDRDVRVPIFHGRDFYNAVKDHIPAQMLVQKDANHGFPWPQHRREYLSALVEYLENDCGPGGL